MARFRGFSLIEVIIGLVILAIFIAPVLSFFTNIKSSEIDVQKMSEMTLFSVSVFELLKAVDYDEVVCEKLNIDFDFIRGYLAKIPDAVDKPTFQELADYYIYISKTRKILGQIEIEEITDEFGTVKKAEITLKYKPTVLKNPNVSEKKYKKISFQFILAKSPGIN